MTWYYRIVTIILARQISVTSSINASHFLKCTHSTKTTNYISVLFAEKLREIRRKVHTLKCVRKYDEPQWQCAEAAAALHQEPSLVDLVLAATLAVPSLQSKHKIKHVVLGPTPFLIQYYILTESILILIHVNSALYNKINS